MASTREVRIEIRLKPRESRAWRAAARRSDLTLSEWLRQLGNAAAGRRLSVRTTIADGGE